MLLSHIPGRSTMVGDRRGARFRRSRPQQFPGLVKRWKNSPVPLGGSM